jgi:predicted phosphodiesterase
MKLQILSDQHIDFKKNFGYFTNRCHPRADTLIMAGDLCPHNSPITYNYINTRILPRWKNTILIPGNHEFYESTVDDEFFGSAEKIYTHHNGNKFHYVNNKVVILEGIHFICSTLWSHVGHENLYNIQNSMNDYRAIKGLTVDKMNLVHAENARFLQEAVDAVPDGKRCVVITHHLPSFHLITPRYRNNSLNEAFAADMDVFIMKNGHKISHWIHGHSHDEIDEVINGVRFIRNPMGYPQERDCNMDMVITI